MDTSKKSVLLTRTKFVALLVAACAAGAVIGSPMASGLASAAKKAVTIADPSNGHRAHVSAAGRLETEECDSNSCADVDAGKLRIGDGSGPLTVDGTVTGYPYPPARAFSAAIGVNAQAQFVDKGHKVDLTSVTLDNSTNSDSDISLYTLSGTSAGCSGGFLGDVLWEARVPANTTVSVSFPSPLIVTDPCAQFFQDLGTAFVETTVTGFTTS